MREINYLELIKKAWNITWRNKFLWWFGLFLALGGGINFNFNIPGRNNWIENQESAINNFLEAHWILVLIGILILVIIALFLFVLKTLSYAGLLKALIKLEKKESTSFGQEFKNGKKYFWKIIAAEILVGLFTFGIILVLVVPVLFSFFYIESMTLGLILSFLGAIIMVPLIVLAVYLCRYARFYIVLSDLGVRESLENGYKIFKKNMLPSILLSLLFIPIGMLMTLVFIGLVFVLALVFLVPGITAYFIFSTAGIIGVIAVAFFVFLASFILASSIYMTFANAAWFLFFKEIATEKEDPIEEKEEEAIEKLPNPEEA